METHNADIEAQNTQVNQCINNSINQLQSKTTTIMATKHKLECLEGTSNQLKIRDVILEDLQTLETQFGEVLNDSRKAFVTQSKANHMEGKITLLNVAATCINELGTLIKSADHICK